MRVGTNAWWASSDHAVTMQSFNRKANGMRRAADDNQNFWEEPARREEDGAPLLRCAICGHAKDAAFDVFVNAPLHANGCGALRGGTKPSGVQKRDNTQKTIKLLHSRDRVICFEIRRVFLKAIQEAQDA